jgi:hypothetical protein
MALMAIAKFAVIVMSLNPINDSTCGLWPEAG